MYEKRGKKYGGGGAPGIMADAERRQGRLMYQSDRVLIIGSSGSGKTFTCVNLIINCEKNFNNLVIISPSEEDAYLNYLAELADEAGMNVLFTAVDSNGNLKLPEDIEKTVFIVDDYYSPRKQDPKIVKLLNDLFIRCRHMKNHVYYIVHSPKFIPHVIKMGASTVYIQKPYPKDIPGSEVIPRTNDKHQFWRVDNYETPSAFEPVHFPPMTHDQALKIMKAKIYKEDSKLKTKPGLNLTKMKVLKAESKIGNKAAAQAVAKTEQKEKQLNNLARQKLSIGRGRIRAGVDERLLGSWSRGF